MLEKCTWIFNGVDVAKLFAIADWCYELRLIALDDIRADIRNANEARKEAQAELQYQGFTEREAQYILKWIEKLFGLI